MIRFAVIPALALALTVLSACTTVSYLGQAATGQLGLMLAREDIDHLLADPNLDSELRQRLETVQSARRFAVGTLGLPDQGSYRSYVSLDRDYPVWNVVAAPEFSVNPETWCFPIAGCVPYKGFFSLKLARHEARRLQRAGLDVSVSGATAYSTLGYLKDPVLSSMLRYSDATLAGLIFHELAHQRVYVPGDSAFNEAYATAVERAGVRQWAGAIDDVQSNPERRAFDSRVRQILLAARRDLRNLYACDLPHADKRRLKQARFARLRDDYRSLARQSSMDHWDGFFASTMNNADLALIATYEENVAPILEILESLDNDWPAFHQRMAEIAALDAAARARLLGLAAPAAESSPACRRGDPASRQATD